MVLDRLDWGVRTIGVDKGNGDGREMEMEWVALHCMRWLWHVEMYCFRNLGD